MHIVAKPFNTAQRRFRLNAEVTETDDLSPHSFADMKSRGFIVEKLPVKPAEPTAPAGKRPTTALRDLE